jgi:hypothetical protein
MATAAGNTGKPVEVAVLNRLRKTTGNRGESCLLECSALQFGKEGHNFQRKQLPPSTEWKSKPDETIGQ